MFAYPKPTFPLALYCVFHASFIRIVYFCKILVEDYFKCYNMEIWCFSMIECRYLMCITVTMYLLHICCLQSSDSWGRVRRRLSQLKLRVASVDTIDGEEVYVPPKHPSFSLPNLAGVYMHWLIQTLSIIQHFRILYVILCTWCNIFHYPWKKKLWYTKVQNSFN